MERQPGCGAREGEYGLGRLRGSLCEVAGRNPHGRGADVAPERGPCRLGRGPGGAAGGDRTVRRLQDGHIVGPNPPRRSGDPVERAAHLPVGELLSGRDSRHVRRASGSAPGNLHHAGPGRAVDRPGGKERRPGDREAAGAEGHRAERERHRPRGKGHHRRPAEDGEASGEARRAGRGGLTQPHRRRGPCPGERRNRPGRADRPG